MREPDKNIMRLLSGYHIFPIRNNVHAVFQALTAFTSWQRSDRDTETQISGGVSGGNSLFISLSIIIKHACLLTWISGYDTIIFLFLFYPAFLCLSKYGIHAIHNVFIYIHCLCYHYMFLCLFTLHNERERTQRHCNYIHYYHKINLCVYSHTRRIHLIESISFADDGFTFCHGGCCLISMLWKYGFISWLISAASTSSALLPPLHPFSPFSLTISLTLPIPAEKWW